MLHHANASLRATARHGPAAQPATRPAAQRPRQLRAAALPLHTIAEGVSATEQGVYIGLGLAAVRAWAA
jgi:hypothetical protein